MYNICIDYDYINLVFLQELCFKDTFYHLVILWIPVFAPVVMFFAGYFMALPLSERVSGVKHLQMMTKLSPITYWAAFFVWDYFFYIIVITLTLATLYSFDENHLFTSANELSKLLIFF